MKKRTLPGEVLYSFMRVKNKRTGEDRLDIINNNPARGVERRTITKSRDPHSSLASRSLSRPARLLLVAKTNAEAREELIQELVYAVERIAKFEGWKIKLNARAVAEIALDPFINIELLSQAKKAHMCNVKPPSYIECWQPKVDTVQTWIKRWSSELSK